MFDLTITVKSRIGERVLMVVTDRLRYALPTKITRSIQHVLYSPTLKDWPPEELSVSFELDRVV